MQIRARKCPIEPIFPRLNLVHGAGTIGTMASFSVSSDYQDESLVGETGHTLVSSIPFTPLLHQPS